MIELRTLGGVDLRVFQGEIVRPLPAQPKRLALLIYLALGDPSGFRRRDSAVGLLWPELDTLHARGALRQALHSLRRLIGEDAIGTRGEEEIGIHREALWCDAVAFRESVDAGRHENALKLYRGDFLEGFFVSDVAPEFDQWIADTQADLRRRAAGAAWELAEGYRASGELANASSYARRASALALEDENGVARLIAFLDEMGDRSGALEVYEDLATRLKKEYDADPSPETKALVKRVRERTAASNLPVPRKSAVSQKPPVTRSEAESPATPVEPLLFPLAASGPNNLSRRRNRFRIVAAVTALAVVVIAIAKIGPGSAKAPYSIAVLPLQDLSGDTSRAYIADGVTDQLITDLAQLGTLQVINRRTMMTYRGSLKSAREIAKELNADGIISGTIQTLGDTVRMTAQLVLARSDRAIWAQTFEGTRGDLLRMQREAARVAAQSIRGVLTPAQQSSLPHIRRMDPEALDLYIKGRYYWNKRGAGLVRSIDMFAQALDLDPTFALAYSGTADAYVQLGYGNGLAPSDAFPKARAAAMHALQLDSTLAEPHAALGFVHMYYDWNWTEADREFRRAIALNPSYATAHEWYGLFLAAMGRSVEARREERRAEDLDPLSVPIAGTSAWVLFYTGNVNAAKGAIQIALREDKNFALGHLYLGRMQQQTGAFDSALVQYDASGPLRDWIPTLAGKAYVLASVGRKAEARVLLTQMDSMSRKSYVTAYGVALVYAALHNPDSAFAWLDKGLGERTNWMVWLNRDRRWDPIRSDPRFIRLTQRIGLPK